MSDTTFSLATVIDDAKKVITNPVGFYKEMPTTGGYPNPLIFVVVLAAITGLLISILALVGLGNAMMAGGIAIAAIFIFPIMAIIGSFIGAAILFVIWKLMGSEKNYEVAYRCVSYSFAIAPVVVIISIIPYLAAVVKTLWSAYLMFVASVEVHNLKAATAKIVFGVLAVLGVLFSVSSERAARNMQHMFENSYSNSELPAAFKDLENIEDMTPEEAGRQMGEFLKGLEGFSKGLEESVSEDQKKAND